MLKQQVNDPHRRHCLTLSLNLLHDSMESYLSHFADAVEGTPIESIFARFLFRKYSVSIASQLKREGKLEDYQLSNLIIHVNKYKQVMLNIDLVYGLMENNKINFSDSDFKIIGQLPEKYIKIEKSVIKSKVDWFTSRISTWRKYVKRNEENKVEFENFSDYNFGTNESFQAETAKKVF